MVTLSLCGSCREGEHDHRLHGGGADSYLPEYDHSDVCDCVLEEADCADPLCKHESNAHRPDTGECDVTELVWRTSSPDRDDEFESCRCGGYADDVRYA